jgi:hypothetical protein
MRQLELLILRIELAYLGYATQLKEDNYARRPGLAYNGGSDPLDYGKINTPEQILKQTDIMESICVDEEKMQFQVGCSIQDLWKSAFENEVNNVHTIKERLNGNKFHDTIIEEFLSDYDAI